VISEAIVFLEKVSYQKVYDMSSPTLAHPCEAVVEQNGQPTGPVRLPLVDQQLFIDAFNTRYQGKGLSITESAIQKSQCNEPHSQ